ncbi:MAG TPA: MEDS domain-containing protein [Candidatus Dormibacteraeota bacterium]|nr:MEDS domain-containing protein [Candidatus Dormibacteraeota bacterium]
MSDQYVGTREAARLLGVSEASVRRWSDAGLLTPHRVGRRGERRFARSDVLQLRGPGRQGQSPQVGSVVLEGAALPVHTHLGAFYTTERGQLRLAIPFLRDGLLAGQHCVVLANPETRRVFEAELKADRVEVDRAVSNGLLGLFPPSDALDEGIDFYERIFTEITRGGGTIIRMLGEATQQKDSLGSMELLMGFESALDVLVHRFPVVLICQYDARKVLGPEVIAALKLHADDFDHPLGMLLN